MSSTSLSAGQNTSVTALSAAGASATLRVSGAVDVTALVLSADGKVSGDADMVFFNQPAAPGLALHPDGSLTLTPGELRPGAHRVALVASPADDGATFAGVGPLLLRVSAGAEELTFTPAPAGSETALVLAEVYEREGTWKLRAVGQGYDSGLAGVAAEYGITVDDPAPPSAPAPAAPVGVDLVKEPIGAVSLSKAGSAKIPLTKADTGSLVLTLTLAWDGRGDDDEDDDLDLYALVRDDGPEEKAVYYRDLGSLTSAPWVALDGDSRSPGSETIRVVAGRNRFVLLCAYSAVGNGTGSFRSYRARVVVDDGAGSVVTVPLYEDDPHSYWVAIAKLDFTDPGSVKVEQVERYGLEHAEERPVLHGDGRVEMSVGVVEFKDDDDDLDELLPGLPVQAPKKKGWFSR